MTTVPREMILQAWERVCALDEEQTTAITKQFLDEQPALSMYLLASTEELGVDAGQSNVIDLTIAIWDAMTLARGRRLKAVRPKVIDHAEATNTRMLEKLELGSEFDWTEAVRQLVHGYNQRELLGFCIEVLMGDDEETPELAPDRIGLEMLWLKTIIDCLDQ
jgi:hypothetical protein